MLRKTSFGDEGGGNGSKLAPEWIFLGLNFSDISSCTGWTANSSTASAVASHGHALALELIVMDVYISDESWCTGELAEPSALAAVAGRGHVLALG